MNEETKQKIIDFNNQFGIRTEFITGESTLGYALGNTIYINTSINQDYEKTNKHELLHFFEGTPEFEKVKKDILEKNAEELPNIRKEYELRYWGIYSKEEINAGVLDNEIVIDIMTDNSSIVYEEGLKVGDIFLGEVQQKLAEKRYLNLSLTGNIKNMKLSEWEKIFVLNYYDGKDKILPQGKDRVEKIREDIEKYLNELSKLDKTTMQIDPYSPEVIREYESEIKALKARGEDTTRLEENPEMGYKKIAEETSKQLYEEYKHIVDLINGLDMEPAFKSMMLRETLTKVYKLDKDNKSNGQKTIIKNRDMKKSIGGHMILNEQTLKFIYENVKNIEEYKNFANLYFAAVEVYKDTIASKSGIMLDGVDTYGKGKWIKFEGKNTNPEEYLKNASELAALVQDTPWCTKQLASSQLAEGDFYVFVDNTGKPHIAVKTRGDTIDEVRGIKNGNAQELEEEYRDVAISFLENNKDIENGKEWLEKEEWNKRLIEYARKIDNGEFKVEDVPKFIEDYLKKDYRNQGGENSNKKALKDRLEKIKGVVAEYYSCSEEEITFGDVNFAETQLTTVPYKIIFGDADFRGSQIKNLGSLRSIGGNADFRDLQVEDMGSLRSIGGDANFERSQVKSLGLLESIGGNADFRDSQVEDMGSLRSIGGDAYITGPKIKSLGLLESIGGNADFRDSQVEDMGSLRSIGGDAYITGPKIKSLGLLESIGGNADFRDSQVEDMGSLRSIGGDANFERSQVKSLGLLESIGGYACFGGSRVEDLGSLRSIGGNAYITGPKIKSLGLLESIGGYACFGGSQVEDLGSLRSIGGSANFKYSQIKRLGLLENIGGNADFYDSQVEDMGSLRSIGGDADFGRSQVKSLGLLESIGGNADFRDSQVEDMGSLRSIGGDAYITGPKIKSLGLLESIGGNADFYDLQVEDMGSLRSIGGDADFGRSQVKSLGLLESIGGNADFRDSQVEDMGSLRSIGGDADFGRSQVKSLGLLESIGGYAYFGGSRVEDLGSLRSIGGDANFERSQVKSLGLLESIGGNAYITGQKIKSLGLLESIGGYACFGGSQVEDLGSLRSIGGSANFKYSQIKRLGLLENIGGDADFRGSLVEDLGSLRSIDKIIYLDDSQIEVLKQLNQLKQVGSIVGSEKLRGEYKKTIRERFLSGNDIGQAGFGVGIEECDRANEFLMKIMEEIDKKWITIEDDGDSEFEVFENF